MPGRSTTELLAQLERFIPSVYKPGRPIFAGYAAMMAQMEALGVDTMLPTATHAGAAEMWLTLLAKGYGLERATGEDDASLLIRLRNPGRQVTRANILAIVDAILAAYTTTPAEMLEWFEEGLDGSYYDDDFFFDEGRIIGDHNTFGLILPFLTDGWPDDSDAYLDDEMFFDDEVFLGGGTELHPAYRSLAAGVASARAAGIGVWVTVE